MGNIFRGFNKIGKITNLQGTDRTILFSVSPILDRLTTAYLVDFSLIVDINSLNEFTYIPDDTLTDSQQNEAYRQASINAQKKLISVQMDTGNGWFEAIKFAVYNKQPYYQVDLISRLTEQSQLIVGQDTKLALQMIDPLGVGDSINVLINGTEETYNPFEVSQ